MFCVYFCYASNMLSPFSRKCIGMLIGIYLFFISSFAPIGLLAVSGVSSNEVKGQMAATCFLDDGIWIKSWA